MCFFFFQAEDGIRDLTVTGVQTCALPIYRRDTGAEVAHKVRKAPDESVFAVKPVPPHVDWGRGANDEHAERRNAEAHRDLEAAKGEDRAAEVRSAPECGSRDGRDGSSPDA